MHFQKSRKLGLIPPGLGVMRLSRSSAHCVRLVKSAAYGESPLAAAALGKALTHRSTAHDHPTEILFICIVSATELARMRNRMRLIRSASFCQRRSGLGAKLRGAWRIDGYQYGPHDLDGQLGRSFRQLNHRVG